MRKEIKFLFPKKDKNRKKQTVVANVIHEPRENVIRIPIRKTIKRPECMKIFIFRKKMFRMQMRIAGTKNGPNTFGSLNVLFTRERYSSRINISQLGSTCKAASMAMIAEKRAAAR